jgi:hypothetical protein
MDSIDITKDSLSTSDNSDNEDNNMTNLPLDNASLNSITLLNSSSSSLFSSSFQKSNRINFPIQWHKPLSFLF